MLRLLTNYGSWFIIWFVPATMIGLVGYLKDDNQTLYIISACWAVFWIAAGIIASELATKRKK